MKLNLYTTFFFTGFLLFSITTQAQFIRLNRTTRKSLINNGTTLIQTESPLKIGLSLGYNFSTQKLYDLSINPVDYTVQFEKIRGTSFVLSTAVMMSLKTYYLREKKDPAGSATKENTTGDIYSVPSRWSIGLIVNIAQFSSQDNLYNRKIDGGLGIGYELNDNIFLLGSCEFLSVVQPRDYFVTQYRDQNKQFIVDGSVTKMFNYGDKNIFTTKYLPFLSFKIVVGLELINRKEKNELQRSIRSYDKLPGDKGE